MHRFWANSRWGGKTEAYWLLHSPERNSKNQKRMHILVLPKLHLLPLCNKLHPPFPDESWNTCLPSTKQSCLHKYHAPFRLIHYHVSLRRCSKAFCSAFKNLPRLLGCEKPKSKSKTIGCFPSPTIKLCASTSPWTSPHLWTASSAWSAAAATSWVTVSEKNAPQRSR